MEKSVGLDRRGAENPLDAAVFALGQVLYALLNDHIVESGVRQLSEARVLLDPFEILQACALPRLGLPLFAMFLNQPRKGFPVLAPLCPLLWVFGQIGRASCRESVCQ